MGLELDSPFEDFFLGDSHYVMGEKVGGPMDFSEKNFMIEFKLKPGDIMIMDNLQCFNGLFNFINL